MEWKKDISEDGLYWMEFLGDFGPTTPASKGTIKGYMYDSDDGGGYKTYLGIAELRELGRACIEVADWLEKRKNTPAAPEEDGDG